MQNCRFELNCSNDAIEWGDFINNKHNNEIIDELINMLEIIFNNFKSKNKYLISNDEHEIGLCAALMIDIHDYIKNTIFYRYYVDLEYNRNGSNEKCIETSDNKIKNIRCDLIIHSRNEIKEQDNLIAIEMKKTTGKRNDKMNDKIRLKNLTKQVSNPKCVGNYLLGVYIELDSSDIKEIKYYVKGKEYLSNSSQLME